jgi:hypothetical protein
MRYAAWLGDLSPLTRCVVWDLSPGGARFAVVARTGAIPKKITLWLAKTDRRDCEVVWRDKRFLGVKFI